MLKPFLVAFDSTQLSRQSLLDHLDTRPEVKNWFAFLPSAVVVLSDRTAFNVAACIRAGFPTQQFIVTEIPQGGNDGWLGKNVWEFINNPQSSGRWPT
jgi:hypothetical protein